MVRALERCGLGEPARNAGQRPHERLAGVRKAAAGHGDGLTRGAHRARPG
jgi:hypothetical protein